MNKLVAISLLALAGTAMAQPVPGMKPLVEPAAGPVVVTDAAPERPKVESRRVDRGEAAAKSDGQLVPGNAADKELAMEMLARDVASQRSSLPTGQAHQYPGAKIGAGEITVSTNRTEVIAIARDQLNRFVTPFNNPIAKTTAPATTTSAEGAVLYVATASTSPISMFIVDGDNPVNAITLTLVPRDVPAASMTLKADPGSMVIGSARDQADVEHRESSDSFVDVIRSTMVHLAKGEIPAGYGLRKIERFEPNVPSCIMPGLDVQPAQEMTGTRLKIFVLTVRNRTGVPQSIDEKMCGSDRVVAVAAWPAVDIEPGQATELFIATRREVAPRQPQRPSTIH